MTWNRDKGDSMEKLLDYDRNVVPQETSWWCGPATCQVILNSQGKVKSERDLTLELEALEGNHGWDDQDGTDHIRQIVTVLNKYTGGGYTVTAMPNDPPTLAQKEQFWQDLVRSINGGNAVAINIDAPSWNYPRGTRGSRSPAYGGGRVLHYFTAAGWYEGADGRHTWIADSGFPPYGYWMSFDQLATLVPPKGYAAKPSGLLTPQSDQFLGSLSQAQQDQVWAGFAQWAEPHRG